jgi:hypothetical protein
MKKVRVKKFKDAFLKQPIENSLNLLENFLVSDNKETVYYSGNLQEDILSNYNKKQSNKLFKRMGKYTNNENLMFFQKKIDKDHGYYDYIVRKR